MFREYQVCSKCVMDTSDPSIKFDENGICSHCHWYEQRGIKQKSFADLISKVEDIKLNQKNSNYDVILGLSGGIDSSFLLYYCVVKLNLRPLVVHCDNGWNSEAAIHNIELLVKKLNLDLYTYIIDWEEFRELQRAFFYSDNIDLEMVTDHAMNAIQQIVCEKFKIKYSVSGQNYQSESILPRDWVHDKMDFSLIQKTAFNYGINDFKTYPYINKKLIDIEFISPLNHIDYNKEDAKKILNKFCDWKEYGGKHSESIFTKFYQNYILPTKYNIDKRRAHLSSMIKAKQITRNEALQILEKPIYDEVELINDKKYVLKKLRLDEKWFNEYIKKEYDS